MLTNEEKMRRCFEFARVLPLYLEKSDKIRYVIREMAGDVEEGGTTIWDVIKNTRTYPALLTLVEALFPSESVDLEAQLLEDAIEEVKELRESDEAQRQIAEDLNLEDG